MNMKALLLLPGTLALMLATSPLIPGFTSAAVAQSMQRQGHGQGWESQLNLTDAQKAQIRQYRQSERQQSDAVFTSDQKAQLQAARQNHTKPTLNLSNDQKAQLQSIHQQTESQIQSVLTPDQQQQYQQWKQSHQRPQ